MWDCSDACQGRDLARTCAACVAALLVRWGAAEYVLQMPPALDLVKIHGQPVKVIQRMCKSFLAGWCLTYMTSHKHLQHSTYVLLYMEVLLVTLYMIEAFNIYHEPSQEPGKRMKSLYNCYYFTRSVLKKGIYKCTELTSVKYFFALNNRNKRRLTKPLVCSIMVDGETFVGEL